jgi:PAS domain S-box-containing protein
MAANPTPKNLKIKFPWLILFSFFIFTAGILVLGRVYYRSQITRINKEAQESLTAIANLKIRQIEQWRTERLGNAEQIRNNNPLIKSIKECIAYNSRQETEADVKQWMNSIASNYDYNSVFIYDTLQKTRLASTQSDSLLPEITKIAFAEALKDMKARMTDLYRNGSSGLPTIDLIVPVGLNIKKQLKPVGVIVLRIDPSKTLFPLIQSWPTSSKSAETLLIRKEGDSVLYMNDLRHIQNTALNLKLPLTDKNLLAAKAVSGFTGVVEGVDYRKVTVVGYVSSIPGLNWFIVAKIDKEEIQAPLKKASLISVLVTILLILIVASVLLFWIRNQQFLLSREQLRNELGRKQLDESLIVSETRYRRLFEASRDGILILEAETGLIVDVNPYLVEMLGVSREQFLKKSIWEIGFFKDIASNKEKFLELQQKDYVRYEDLPLEKADGRKFHVEFVSNVYEVRGFKVIQCNIRDISKRKEMEDALQEWNNQFKKLASNVPGMIFQFTRKPDGSYFVPIASEGIKEIFGCSPEDVSDDFTPIAKVILPEDLERVVRDIEYSAQHFTLFDCDFRAQVSGKPVKWLNTKSTPEKLVNGTITWYGFITEITERKEAEEELQKSEERFRMLFESIGDAVMISELLENGKIGKFIQVNNAACIRLGYSREEMLMKTPLELNSEKSRQSINPKIKNIIEEKHAIVEAEHVTKDGRIIPVEISTTVTQINDKTVFLSFARDISERKLVEEKLRETNEYLSNLFNYANAPIIVWDTSLLITKFNNAFENLTGYFEEEVLDKKIDILFPEDKAGSSLKMINKAVSGERWETVEIEIKRKDGSIRTLLWNSANIMDLDYKTVTATIAQGHDITERKLAEIMLREEKERIRAILDQVGDPIFVKDNDHRVILANRAFFDIFCMDEKSVIGYTLVEAVPENERHHFLSVDRSVLDTGISDLREEELTVNDLTRTIITRKIRFIDESGNRFLVGSIHDITDRKKMEDELHESETKFRQTFEFSPVGKVMVGLDKRFTHCNNAFAKSLGYSVEELIGKTIADVTYPDDQEVGMDEMIAIAKGKLKVSQIQKRYLRKDGEIIWCDVTISLVRDLSEHPKYFLAIIQDITRRRQAEELVRDNEKRFREIIESLPQLFWTCRVDGPCDYLSRQWVEYTGIPEADQLGYRWLEQLHPEDKDRTISEWMEKVITKESFDIEFRIRRNDGIFHWFKTRAVPMFDSNGNIIKWFGSNTDIDEILRAEKDLKEAELKFRTIFDKASDGMILAENGSSTFYMANNKICEILGYSLEEILKIGVGDIHLKKDLPYAREQFDRLLRREISIAPGIPVRKKNGTVFYADITASIVNIGGKDYLLGVFRDITERIIIEEKIKRLNEDLEETVIKRTAQLQDTLDFNQKIIETSSLGIFACIEDGPCIIANPAVAKISGASVDEMLKLNFRELDSWKMNGLFGKVETAFITNEPQRAEIHLTTSFGRDAWLDYFITTFRSAGKLHFLMTVDEITERKLAEIELNKYQAHLEERTAQLEASNKELEAFSYSVSHDLRAPLRAVHSYTNILLEDYEKTLDDEGKRICGIISSSATQMGELIDDLLSFSRIGRSTLNPSMLNMKTLAGGVFADLNNGNADRKIKVKMGKLHSVFGDGNLLKIVWTNLISNAIKYSSHVPSSEIVISSSKEDHTITYSVKDYGVGFDMQYKHKLFGVFQRLHSESEFEGNGVGLAIVQRIVMKHGGKVWAEGEVGKGATFFFSLPASGMRLPVSG